jgi:hypothetical protein
MEEEKKEDCQSCKKGLSMSQKYMVGISIYIMISGIYGTYKLFELLISLF